MPAFVLAFNLLVLLLSWIGMMTVFLGGHGYLGPLLVLLGLSVPVTFILLFAALGWFVKAAGWRHALHELSRHVPGWLNVAFWLAVALIVCGELALILALRLEQVPPAPWQHLPLLAGLGAASAFYVSEAARRARRASAALDASGSH